MKIHVFLFRKKKKKKSDSSYIVSFDLDKWQQKGKGLAPVDFRLSKSH